MIIELAEFKWRVYFPLKRWILTNCPNFIPKHKSWHYAALNIHCALSIFRAGVFTTKQQETNHGTQWVYCVCAERSRWANAAWLIGVNSGLHCWLFPAAPCLMLISMTSASRSTELAWSWRPGSHTGTPLPLPLSLNVFLSLFVTAHICWYNAFFQSAQACSAIQIHFFTGYKQDVFLHTPVISSNFSGRVWDHLASCMFWHAGDSNYYKEEWSKVDEAFRDSRLTCSWADVFYIYIFFKWG